MTREEADALFDEFMLHNQRTLTRYAMAVFNLSASDADDVISVVAYKVHRQWSKLMGDTDHARAYFRKSIRNQVYNNARSRRRRREDPLEDRADKHVLGPEAIYIQIDHLARAIKQLPERKRMIIWLRYWERASELEIADTMDIRPGTVKSQASKALSELRQLLDPTSSRE